MELSKILAHIRPGESWSCQNDDYATLTWHDVTEKPTLEEVEAGETALALLAYRELRRVAYPPIGDQLDALWKGGDDAAAMLAQVMAVKAQYPKPE